MPLFSLVPVWLFIIFACMQEFYISMSLPNPETGEMQEFFDQIEKVMDKFIAKSNYDDTTQKSEARKSRYLVPEEIMNQEKEVEDAYGYGNKIESINSQPSSQNRPFYSANDIEGKNPVIDFEGYQEFIFRPLYPCDSYDSAQRHCILRRQLGTTLTLGVQVGEGLRRGMKIYWYRCLRKKYFDHIIKEPLNKGFLPWNLNLGGSSNELRISPISEMDLSYNYFVADLVIPEAYRGKYSQKASIRFDIEHIEYDMGSLYSGEEIVIYARAFIELPRTSVNFLWSLQEKNDFEDRGLPSNMEFNIDKSSVIIKELKTYEDQYLVCKVFSNKDFLLAKRTFLFRGFGRNKTSAPSNHIRFKRYAEDNDQQIGESNEMQFRDMADFPKSARSQTVEKNYNSYPDPEINFREVPEISTDLFYDNSHKNVNLQDSNFKDSASRSQNAMARVMRRFIQKDDKNTNNRYTRTKELPSIEKLRFEDVESQMIATCRTHSDCNIRATCVRESTYGQNYCQCSHGYNGNGLFCFSS